MEDSLCSSWMWSSESEENNKNSRIRPEIAQCTSSRSHTRRNTSTTTIRSKWRLNACCRILLGICDCFIFGKERPWICGIPVDKWIILKNINIIAFKTSGSKKCGQQNIGKIRLPSSSANFIVSFQYIARNIGHGQSINRNLDVRLWWVHHSRPEPIHQGSAPQIFQALQL